MRKALAIGAFLVCAASGGAAQTDPDAYLVQYRAAEEAHRPFTPITAFDPATTLDQAYAVQHRLIEGNRIAGYRGGLMSAASLRQRGVGEPLVGVQFAAGRHVSPATIRLGSYRHPAIEVKIGFVFGRDLAPGDISIASLRKVVKAVVPLIDLPDIGYADPLHYSAVDMVAADISAASYVEGRRTRRCTDLNRESMTLTRDGVTVTRGQGADSLGDVWQSLRTLVLLAERHGYAIHRGDIVLTGKLGGKVDVSEGRYVAAFSCLGSVAVELTR